MNAYLTALTSELENRVSLLQGGLAMKQMRVLLAVARLLSSFETPKLAPLMVVVKVQGVAWPLMDACWIVPLQAFSAGDLG